MKETKENFLKIAVKAVKESGKYLLSKCGKGKIVNWKKDYDFALDVDEASEKKIISLITKNFPEHNILSEETGEIDKMKNLQVHNNIERSELIKRIDPAEEVIINDSEDSKLIKFINKKIINIKKLKNKSYSSNKKPKIQQYMIEFMTLELSERITYLKNQRKGQNRREIQIA